MSRDIRLFLFVKDTGSGCVVSVHRTIEDVRASWEEKHGRSTRATGFLFLGATSPYSAEIEPFLISCEGCMLFSESAVLVLGQDTVIGSRAFGYLDASESRRKMGVYPALAGWGYELSALKAAAAAERHEKSASMVTYEDYLARIEHIDPDDPFQIIKIAPSWLLGVPFTEIPLTIRCRNVLVHSACTHACDLLAYSLKDALRWRNFGVKSGRDLANSLLSFIKAGPPPSIAKDFSALRIETSTPRVPFAVELDRYVATLPEKEAAVFQGRFAMDGERQTLEEIGNRLGLTRERVRQIEKRRIDNVRDREPWAKVFRNRLDALMREAAGPLYLDSLSANDAWFAGFEKRSKCLACIIEAFGGPAHKLCRIGARDTVCSIDTQTWDTLRRTALDYLRSRINTGLSREEIKSTLEGLLRSKNAPELASVFAKGLEEHLHFGTRFADHAPELIAVGLGFSNQLQETINNLSAPLHYLEIAKLCSRDLKRNIDPRKVQAALQRAGALYLGRGIYGNMSHFRLPEQFTATLTAHIRTLFSEGAPGRQWHTSEILEMLIELNPGIGEVVNKYVLNIVLKTLPEVKPMGRMVWVSQLAREELTQARIDVCQACLVILSAHGAPMSTSELRLEISKTRGVGEFFLLHPSREMTRISRPCGD